VTNQAIRTGNQVAQPTLELAPEYDRVIALLYLVLICIGLVMVASASIGIAEQQNQDSFYYAKRQFLRILLSLALMWVACKIPLKVWKRNGMVLMLGSILLLALVLIPGVGHTVNGSTRWLNFGLFTFQISEIAKLFLIIYLSG
jgi:cell division protein FtsW